MVASDPGVDKSACHGHTGRATGYTAEMVPAPLPAAPPAVSRSAALLLLVALLPVAPSCRHEVEPGSDAGVAGEGEGEG